MDERKRFLAIGFKLFAEKEWKRWSECKQNEIEELGDVYRGGIGRFLSLIEFLFINIATNIRQCLCCRIPFSFVLAHTLTYEMTPCNKNLWSIFSWMVAEYDTIITVNGKELGCVFCHEMEEPPHKAIENCHPMEMADHVDYSKLDGVQCTPMAY